MPIGLVRVLVPTYYAIGDTKTPVVAATVSLLLTVALGFFLGRRFEIKGMTVATLFAALGQLLVLALFLGARIRRLETEASLKRESPVRGSVAPSGWVHLAKCVVAMAPGALLIAIASARVSWGRLSWLDSGLFLGFFVLVPAGLYFLVAHFASCRGGESCFC